MDRFEINSDEELMVLYQQGDARAFDILFQRHSGRVMGFLLKKTSSQNAADLVQETFLKLHRSRHQYSSGYPFLPWLFTIARNVFLDFVRLNESRLAQASIGGSDAAAMIDGVLSDVVGSSAVSIDLASVLERLPPGQKQAIELRYQSDWTFEQIADALRTTPANARQLVSRAVKNLRSRLGKK